MVLRTDAKGVYWKAVGMMEYIDDGLRGTSSLLCGDLLGRASLMVTTFGKCRVRWALLHSLVPGLAGNVLSRGPCFR